MIEITDDIYTICFNCIDLVNFKYRLAGLEYRIMLDFGNSSDVLIFKNEDDYNKAIKKIKKGLKELWNN